MIITKTSYAEAEISVAAIVGEEVITTYDLEQRLKIFTLSSNIEVNTQNKKALLQQIRELLIVEKLKTQAAQESSVIITDAELAGALEEIAIGNNVKIDELSEYIERQGLSFVSVYNRIKAELLWQKLVLAKITPQINVTDAEVAESKKIFLAKNKQTEIKYDFLSYKFNDNESKSLAEDLSYKIYQDLKDNKLDFVSVKNSDISTLAYKSEWIDIGKLKPNIRAYLSKIKEGEVSEPFVSGKEILILKLIAKREAKVKLGQNSEEKIRHDLFMSKLENQVSSYFRDIESSYYIERKNIL